MGTLGNAGHAYPYEITSRYLVHTPEVVRLLCSETRGRSAGRRVSPPPRDYVCEIEVSGRYLPTDRATGSSLIKALYEYLPTRTGPGRARVLEVVACRSRSVPGVVWYGTVGTLSLAGLAVEAKPRLRHR